MACLSHRLRRGHRGPLDMGFAAWQLSQLAAGVQLATATNPRAVPARQRIP